MGRQITFAIIAFTASLLISAGEAAADPDFGVAIVEASRPRRIPAGQHLDLTVRVVDVGTTAGRAPSLLVLLSDDAIPDAGDLVLDERLVSTLPVELAIRVSLPFGISPGLRRVLCVVDPSNVLAESNELNNLASAQIDVLDAVGSDIAVESAGAPTSAARSNALEPGGSGTIPTRIRVTGTNPLGGFPVALIYRPDASLGLPSIELGRTMATGVPGPEDLLVPYTIPATGPHVGTSGRLLIMADPDGAVTEPVESNNRLDFDSTVLKTPSYAISSFIGTPGLPAGGSVFLASATTPRLLTVTSPFSLPLFGANFDTISVSTDGLAFFGGSPNFQSNRTGDTFLQIAPCWDTSWEFSPAVQGSLLMAVFGSAPDRVFSAKWVGLSLPGRTGPFETLDMELRIHESSGVVEYIYEPGPDLVLDSATINLDLSGENHGLIGDERASLPMENLRFSPINLPPPAIDLTITQLLAPFNSSRVDSGDPLMVTLRVENAGSLTSLATVADIALIERNASPSGGIPLTTLAIPSLLPGESMDISETVTLPVLAPLSYRLSGVLDPGGVNTESDLSNNSALGSLVITAGEMPFTQQTTPRGFTTIQGQTGTTTILDGTVNFSSDHATVDIGFDFAFDRRLFSKVYVSGRATVFFDPLESPAITTADAGITPLGFGLSLSSTIPSLVLTRLDGQTPNRTRTIEFFRLPRSSGGEYSGQIVLHESGDLELRYEAGVSYPQLRDFSMEVAGRQFQLRYNPFGETGAFTDPLGNVLLTPDLSGAELAPRGLSTSAALTPGASVDLSVTVGNGGTTAAGPFRVGFYFSEDQTIDAQDTLLASAMVPSLAGLSTASLIAAVTIPANATGFPFLVVLVDDQNSVGEISEGDNALSLRINTAGSALMTEPALTQAAVLDPALERGGSLELSLALIDNANVMAGGTAPLAILISEDAVLDATDIALVGELPFAGSTSTPTIPAPIDSLTSADLRTIRLSNVPTPRTGALFLLVIVDPNEQLADLDRSNNFAAIPITAMNDALADLDVVTTSLNADTSGSGLEVSATVVNIGSADTPAGSIRLRQSRTGARDPAADPILLSAPLPAIAAGAGWTWMTTLPTSGLSTALIDTYVEVVPSGPETGAANNLGPLASALAPGPLPPATPELTIHSFVQRQTGTRLLGELLEFDLTFSWRGPTMPDYTAEVVVFAGGQPVVLSSVTNGPLLPFSVHRLRLTGRVLDGFPAATAGFFNLGCRVTSGGSLDLTALGGRNFAASQNVNVEVQAFAPTAELPTVTAGEPLALLVPVLNAGLQLSSPTTLLVFHQSGGPAGAPALLSMAPVPALATNELQLIPVNATIAGAFAAGRGTLRFRIDGVAAGDPSGLSPIFTLNNTSEAPILVLPSMDRDIAVNSFTIPANAFSAGDSLVGTVTLENSGADTAGAFEVRLVLSDDTVISATDPIIGVRMISGLAPGSGPQSFTIDGLIPTNQRSGLYAIGVIVDAADAVAETIETNNVSAGVTVSIAGPSAVELIPEALSLSTTALVSDNDLTWTRSIRNLGADAAGPFEVRLMFSTDSAIDAGDTLLDTVMVTALDGGAVQGPVDQTFRLPAGLPVGPGFIGALVDATGSITEFDETNNASTAIPFTVLAPPTGPELSVESLTLSSATVIQGNTVSLTRVLRNLGDMASGPVTVQVVLSADAVLDATDPVLDSFTISGLDATSREMPITSMVTIPAMTSAGTYTIGLRVDPDDLIAEADESNNTAGLALQVDPAFQLGDPTMDGMINVQDVQAAINQALGTSPQTPLADTDGSGTVNVQDVQAIINLALGL